MATDTREIAGRRVDGSVPSAPGSGTPGFAPRAPADAHGSRVVRYVTDRLVRLVWGVVIAFDIVLVLDFVFRLIGSRDTGFVRGVFTVGATVSSPFTGIFAGVSNSAVHNLMWSDLVVIGLCTLAGWVVVRVIRGFAAP